MPRRRYSVFEPVVGQSSLCEDYESTWTNSPRINGRLVLRQNSYKLRSAKRYTTEAHQAAGLPSPSIYANERYPSSLSWTSVDNRALAKFNGKLRKGSASLGVTLGSWRQSRDMIIQRSRDIGDAADRVREAARHNAGWLSKIRKQRDPLANQVLEYEFGWLPLYADIHASLETVCQEAFPAEFIKSRHRQWIDQKDRRTDQYGFNYTDWSGWAMTTISSKVEISNPNLWLLNRLGLINPATVAWDLVPWSFVVNMFVNANQMIGSITDHVGLNITERSTTRTWNGLSHYQYFNRTTPLTAYDCKIRWHDKDRVVGSIPSYSWEFRVPKLSWELALIASSLALQKVKRLNNLIRGI